MVAGVNGSSSNDERYVVETSVNKVRDDDGLPNAPTIAWDEDSITNGGWGGGDLPGGVNEDGVRSRTVRRPPLRPPPRPLSCNDSNYLNFKNYNDLMSL